MAKNKKNKGQDVVKRWEEYFGAGGLAEWQSLVRHLDISGEYTSKTQCRKALRGVWVNIHDFLDAVSEGRPVDRFRTARDLADYTRDSNKIFPKKRIQKGSPLKSLMVCMFSDR